MAIPPRDPRSMPPNFRVFEPITKTPASVVPSRSTKQDSQKSYAQVDPLVVPPAVLPKDRASAEPKQKRVVPLSIRFSAAEKEVLRHRAGGVGVTVHAYVKSISLGGSYKHPHHPELRKQLLDLNRELTAQGNNLNQVAKRLNGQVPPFANDETMLDVLARAIVRTLHVVRKTLSNGAEASP